MKPILLSPQETRDMGYNGDIPIYHSCLILGEETATFWREAICWPIVEPARSDEDYDRLKGWAVNLYEDGKWVFSYPPMSIGIGIHILDHWTTDPAKHSFSDEKTEEVIEEV